jgi:tetratricopeptide (TPR) repeat protein
MDAMKRAQSLARWLLVLGCLLCAATAFGKPSLKDKRAAAQLEREAEVLVKKGDREQAAERFRKADELEPLIWRKYRLGKVLSDLARLLEAAEVLERATEEKAFAVRERHAAGKVKQLLEEVTSRIPTVSVKVLQPAAPSVTVELDGKTVDPSGGPVPLDPGYHQLTAKAAGHQELSREISLAERASETVEIKLVALKPAGDEEEEEDEGGGGSIGKWPAVLSWGVGVVGLGLGVGFGVAAINETNALLTDYGCVENRCPPEAQDDLDTSKLHGNIATAGFVIGGVGVVLGTVLWLADDASEEPEGAEGAELPEGEAEPADDVARIRVRPLLGPGVIGLDGTF